MEQKEIEEGNKLIETFEGNQCDRNGWFKNEKHHGGMAYKISESKYHSSWDWQIPVWGKIATKTRKLSVSLNQYGKQSSWVHNYYAALASNKPQSGFKVICEMIEYYNQNNKP